MSIFNLLKKIYPLNTSIAGKDNRKKLEIIAREIPLKILNFKSGKKCYDWITPDEWQLNEAYIKSIKTQKKIVDIKNSYLHVINYSKSIKKTLNFTDLKKNLITDRYMPNSIPYATSYYQKNWGLH